MPKIYRLTLIVALLLIAGLMSGCYTMVGRPVNVEESISEKEATEGQVYRYYDYDESYPYYYQPYYYSPYYSPGFYYYDYSPYYDYYREYPWRRDYDGSYVPKKKPETKQRDSSKLPNAIRPENKRENRMESNESPKTPERQNPRVKSRSSTDKEDQDEE